MKIYKTDPSIDAMVRNVMEDFPEKFDFPIEDIATVMTNLPRNAVQIRKIPKLYQFFLDFCLLIEVDEDAWKIITDDKKYALIAHELNRIEVKDNGDYKLLKYDVEAFGLFIDLFGKHYENVEDARGKLKEVWDKKRF